MFDTVTKTLGSAVAANGTFTVDYPDTKNAGSYTGSFKHTMYALNTLYAAPASFTLSFGASNITVTWLGTTTLPAGTNLRMQLDIVGDDKGQPEKVVLPVGVSRVPTHRIDLGAPDVSDADGISASQSVSSGVAALLNGAIGATLDVARNVVAAWTGTAILTITGKDIAGNTVVEKSASGTSHTGTKAFKSITSCTFNASVTGATIGTGNVLGLPFFVSSAEAVLEEFVDGASFSRPAGKVFIPWELEQTQLLAPTAEEIVCPVAGWIYRQRGIVQAAVTTGGDITTEVNGVAVTGLTLTVADGATAGTRYNDLPTTRHDTTTVVAAGDKITVTPGAPFATAGEVNGVLEIDVSAAGRLDGTLVGGVTSAPTATTGDTRGTYAPSITPDGAVAFALLVKNSDPSNIGLAQYTG